MRQPLPNALDIDFQGGLTTAVTPHAGIALFLETGRRSGVMAAAEKFLPQQRSPKGLGQDQMVEAFVLLRALGGDCLADCAGRRRDQGLAALLGYPLPAAATARQWLDRFHDEALLAGRPAQGSCIPREADGPAGLRAVLQHRVRTYISAVVPGSVVTLDVDAQLVESSKPAALWTQAASGTVREWAEVAFVPSRATEQRDLPPYRYLAIRVRKAQGELFSDGNSSKHCAIVTKDWATDGQALLVWQRGKAGTIEPVNRTLKDELGAGV